MEKYKEWMLEGSTSYFMEGYCSNAFDKWTTYSKTEMLDLHRLKALCSHSIVKLKAREMNIQNKAITMGKML